MAIESKKIAVSPVNDHTTKSCVGGSAVCVRVVEVVWPLHGFFICFSAIGFCVEVCCFRKAGHTTEETRRGPDMYNYGGSHT
jgi:hypothetical protein